METFTKDSGSQIYAMVVEFASLERRVQFSKENGVMESQQETVFCFVCQTK